jgi:electron transport complex protein RnfD
MGCDPVFHTLAGGVMLAAAFMVCDPVTTPATRKGRVIFSIGCGILTMIIRVYSPYPDGVLFAVMLMNIVTPYIDRWTGIKPLWTGKEDGR